MARSRPAAAFAALFALLASFGDGACGGGDTPRTGSGDAATTTNDGGARDAIASGDDAGGDDGGGGDGGATRIRLVAGNLSSGTKSSWDGGEGIRLLKALHPDVAMIQEVNYGQNAPSDIRAFVDAAFD